MIALTRVAALVVAGLLIAGGTAAAADPPVFEGPVGRAQCGPGSEPEPAKALQGEVTAADRDTGRSLKPYTCNTQLLGNDPGNGASWQNTWYGDCDYYDTNQSSALGTQVVDVSDSSKPRTTTALTSPAMIDPWESLSVNQKRGLLAGVYTDNGDAGPLIFDVYDVKADCKHPQLLSSTPVSTFNHEGDWAADGMTYYAAGTLTPTITAIDASDPTAPKTVAVLPFTSHGLSTSDDGNRLYATGQTSDRQNGLEIYDVSEIQARKPGAQARKVGEVGWSDGAAAQHTIPITIKGHPYILFVDEGGITTVPGAARIIDIGDETHPRVISKLKLEIHMPANRDRAAETGGDSIFGYDAHYCNVDRRVDPTIVVCSMFESGERVFDIRDLYHPREIAYFNPGGTGQAPKPGSHDNAITVTSGYPSARPRIIPERSEIWFTDQDKGFFAVRLTNGVWPFPESGQTGTSPDLGLPAAATCASRRSFRIRLRVPRGDRLRSARVYVNGKRVRVVSGRRLRAPVNLRGLPRGTVRVRIVARTRRGRTVTRTRTYHTCAPKRRAGHAS